MTRAAQLEACLLHNILEFIDDTNVVLAFNNEIAVSLTDLDVKNNALKLNKLEKDFNKNITQFECFTDTGTPEPNVLNKNQNNQGREYNCYRVI